MNKHTHLIIPIIPHSKDECIPRIIKDWFSGVIPPDDQQITMSIEHLKMIMTQVHDEGKTRQLQSQKPIFIRK